MVLSMSRWEGKVAIVTGASAGIGAAIAERLVKEGLKVAGLARRQDRLEKLAEKLSKEKGRLYPIATDISKEEDILNAFKWISENLGPVHILINNAGIVPNTAHIIDGTVEGWTEIINVNVLGLSVATKEAVRNMKANTIDGHIIHINSLLGHQVVKHPNMTTYAATKFAVTALAETLRLELMNQKSKIKITNITPGWVDTEILDGIRDTPVFNNLIREKMIIDAAEIADGIVYALSTPPHVQIQQLTIRPVIEGF